MQNMSYIEVLSCFTVFEGLGLGVTQGDYLHEGKTLKIKFFFNLLDQIMSKKKNFNTSFALSQSLPVPGILLDISVNISETFLLLTNFHDGPIIKTDFSEQLWGL